MTKRATHLLHCATLIDHYHLSLADAAYLLHDLGGYFYYRGRYTEVEQFCQRALKIKEQALGGEDPETATTQWGLAALYKIQGQYTRAEPLYRQALAIMEKVIPHHPDTRQLREGYDDLLSKMKGKG